MNTIDKVLLFFVFVILCLFGAATMQQHQSAPCPADCECSEEIETTGLRGWRAEAKAINKRIDSLEARFIPGLRPGAIGKTE